MCWDAHIARKDSRSSNLSSLTEHEGLYKQNSKDIEL